MRTILLISPYWKEEHRWMISSTKMAELWQRIGYRVIVLCMGKGLRYERLSETLEIHRVRDIFLPDPWNYGIALGFSISALRLAKNLKPDIIIVNKILFWSSFSLLWLRLVGYRVLLMTDALVGITWWPRSNTAKVCAAIYAWTAGWLICRMASSIIFFHPQPTALLQRLGIAKKSCVIPTGIDEQSYSARGTHASSMHCVVTYIGRLESVKGVDDFIIAALHAKRSNPSLEIRVIGWSKPHHPLVDTYKDRVSFLGLCDNIPAQLWQTDIFVLPSHSEGLSNALMEAMASGCACIVSDVGGNAFLIQNGLSGFLFPVGDRAALSAHISRLVTDAVKRESLGLAARRRIEQHFSWRAIGKQYELLFAEWTSPPST